MVLTGRGHPSEYLKGYEIGKTLEGHGVKIFRAEGENLESLWTGLTSVLSHTGPAALISKRVMCPGIEGLEGSPHGHDVIPVDKAVKYLSKKSYGKQCADILQAIKPSSVPYLYVGSSKEKDACRVQFGKAVNLVLDTMSKEEVAERVMCIDSDLEGSTGLKAIHQSHPECFVSSGIVRPSFPPPLRLSGRG